jgi:hypothetical protein
MIDKQLVKEVSNFIATFLGILESFISTHGKSSDEEHINNFMNLTFKVSGAVEGYLIVATRDQPGERSHLKQADYSAELVDCYNRKAASSAMQSFFRIDVLNENYADEIMYSARKAEPQITMRIQVKNYAIELYAFTHQKNENHVKRSK